MGIQPNELGRIGSIGEIPLRTERKIGIAQSLSLAVIEVEASPQEADGRFGCVASRCYFREEVERCLIRRCQRAVMTAP